MQPDYLIIPQYQAYGNNRASVSVSMHRKTPAYSPRRCFLHLDIHKSVGVVYITLHEPTDLRIDELLYLIFYIIGGIAPAPPAATPFSSGISVITAPVVNIMPAVLAAAAIAVFTTLAGSIIPDAIISTYSPVWAL